ncbi:hypothetical protein EDD16DRAFT_1438664, partial [Pisolithus croceorrhizus]
GQERLGEVQYFARLPLDATEEDAEEARFEDIALVRLYTIPDKQLLQISSHVLMSIKSVVGMIPYHLKGPSGAVEDCFFLMEKPGLDIS